MKNLKIILLALVFLWFGISRASATPVLYDWAFNIDGVFTAAPAKYDPTGMPVPVSGSLGANGLGTLSWTTNVAGSHNFIAFFDHEIDEAINTYPSSCIKTEVF